MSIYEQVPQAIIVRGHYHNPWQGISGSTYQLDGYEGIPNPTYLDLSVVVCDYCGNRYFATNFKQSGKCLGCGAIKFHFER